MYKDYSRIIISIVIAVATLTMALIFYFRKDIISKFSNINIINSAYAQESKKKS